MTGSDVWIYDTQDHQIGGFSQQQGSGGSITFSSQFGTVNLASLPVVSRNGVAQAAPPTPILPAAPLGAERSAEPLSSTPLTTAQPSSNGAGQDILGTLERLGALKDKGYITDEEFATKKAELLSRL